MQGLFKYFHLSPIDDTTDDCEKSLENLKRIRSTFPPVENKKNALVINLKA